MKPTRNSSVSLSQVCGLNLGQLVLPAILFYAYPLIYNKIFTSYDHSKDFFYQWSLITMLLSWGIGSFLSGVIFNKYGAKIGAKFGFFFALISYLLSLYFHGPISLIFISILIGISLSYLFLDTVIVRYQEVSRDPSEFNKLIMWFTLVSGFASTFSYLAINPILNAFYWKTAIVILIVMILVFYVIYMKSMNTKAQSVAKKSSNIKLKELINGKSVVLLLLFSMQGIIQTMIFFEVLAYFTNSDEKISNVLFAFSLIGIAQIVGRSLVMVMKQKSSKHINLLSAGLITLGILFLCVAAYINSSFIFAFAIFFGAGLGITTIAKPLLINDLYDSNFSFYNGFFSGFLNISRAIPPIVFGFGFLAFNLLNLMIFSVLCVVVMSVVSLFILKLKS